MSVVAMGANCLWLLVIGGWKSEPIKWFKGFSTDYASPKFALIEMSEWHFLTNLMTNYTRGKKFL